MCMYLFTLYTDPYVCPFTFVLPERNNTAYDANRFRVNKNAAAECDSSVKRTRPGKCIEGIGISRTKCFNVILLCITDINLFNYMIERQPGQNATSPR